MNVVKEGSPKKNGPPIVALVAIGELLLAADTKLQRIMAETRPVVLTFSEPHDVAARVAQAHPRETGCQNPRLSI